MSAQELFKFLYKGAAIQSDVEVVGLKLTVKHDDINRNCYDCINCDNDCAC